MSEVTETMVQDLSAETTRAEPLASSVDRVFGRYGPGAMESRTVEIKPQNTGETQMRYKIVGPGVMSPDSSLLDLKITHPEDPDVRYHFILKTLPLRSLTKAYGVEVPEGIDPNSLAMDVDVRTKSKVHGPIDPSFRLGPLMERSWQAMDRAGVSPTVVVDELNDKEGLRDIYASYIQGKEALLQTGSTDEDAKTDAAGNLVSAEKYISHGFDVQSVVELPEKQQVLIFYTKGETPATEEDTQRGTRPVYQEPDLEDTQPTISEQPTQPVQVRRVLNRLQRGR